jgi:hypothetical protein
MVHTRLPPSYYTHLSISPTDASRLVAPELNKSVSSVCSQEAAACFTSVAAENRVQARRTLRGPEKMGVSGNETGAIRKGVTRSAITGHKSGWQEGPSDFHVFGRRREASCHLLATDTFATDFLYAGAHAMSPR